MPRKSTTKRESAVGGTLNVIVAVKRLAYQIHKPRTRAVDSEISVAETQLQISELKTVQKDSHDKEMGKEICTFEESPFYIHKVSFFIF